MKTRNKQKFYSASNATELFEILDIDPADAIEIEFRVKLNKKIVDVSRSSNLTHQQIAAKAKTSRTRVTSILNYHTQGISTDLLLRVLYALGYQAKLSFKPSSKIAA